MTPAEIGKRVDACAAVGNELSVKWEAEMKCFNAAVYCREGAKADESRERLHVLIDQQLDNLSAMTTFSRMLTDAQR